MTGLERFKSNFKLCTRNRAIIPLVLLLAVLLVFAGREGAAAIKQHYILGLDLQEDGCLPHVLYGMRLGRVDEQAPESKQITLERGMYVSFISQDNMMGLDLFDGKRIVKIVAGLEGDVLRVENDQVFVNDVYWGEMSLLGTLGKQSKELDRELIVPEGKLLLMGTLETSYDGRYYGFIDQSAIDAQAFPLF